MRASVVSPSLDLPADSLVAPSAETYELVLANPPYG